MSDDEKGVRALYEGLLSAWNRRDAAGMARLYMEDGTQIGFDGSHVSGAVQTEAHLAPIFANHPTGAFVSIVREIRAIAPNVVLLRADAGMIPAGKTQINPAVNAVQILAAVHAQGAWRIALFQNTPAAFHGCPEAASALTMELQRAARPHA